MCPRPGLLSLYCWPFPSSSCPAAGRSHSAAAAAPSLAPVLRCCVDPRAVLFCYDCCQSSQPALNDPLSSASPLPLPQPAQWLPLRTTTEPGRFPSAHCAPGCLLRLHDLGCICNLACTLSGFATYMHCMFKTVMVLEWIAAIDLEDRAKDETPDAYPSAWNTLKNTDGVLVPGGFGDRGIQGKILAATYARTNGVPYLGICLGMQLAVVAYARNVLGLNDGNSTEIDSTTPHPCVVFMPEVS